MVPPTLQDQVPIVFLTSSPITLPPAHSASVTIVSLPFLNHHQACFLFRTFVLAVPSADNTPPIDIHVVMPSRPPSLCSNVTFSIRTLYLFKIKTHNESPPYTPIPLNLFYILLFHNAYHIFKFFNWSVVDLQCWVNFCSTAVTQLYTYILLH